MTDPQSFWHFAVRCYRCEGVPEACLALQDQHGADVNVLLFCCWIGATRGKFKYQDFKTVLTFSQQWANQVVRPLRAVRTWMKVTGCPDAVVPGDSCMALRERIKSVEFEAEQLQENVMQSILEHIPPLASGTADQVIAAAFNLRLYCRAEGIDWNHQTQAYLATLLCAAIPQGADRASAALREISDDTTI